MQLFICLRFNWVLRLTASSSSSTATRMGHIIAVAAVFEIHIEINIVTAIKPKCSLGKIGKKHDYSRMFTKKKLRYLGILCIRSNIVPTVVCEIKMDFIEKF